MLSPFLFLFTRITLTLLPSYSVAPLLRYSVTPLLRYSVTSLFFNAIDKLLQVLDVIMQLSFHFNHWHSD